jgi:alkanesulfonate monooxygenase SsuD/methylene tetrahydromethanopterin reductase-like flavin-dependent oxidoreductase (luciferase family)
MAGLHLAVALDGAGWHPAAWRLASARPAELTTPLVQDRLDTQFVGSPEIVVRRLAQLQEATGADELAITTITHDHADRVRSYELLAKAWNA